LIFQTHPSPDFAWKWRVALISVLLCTACSQGVPVTTQKIDLQSGSYGVPGKAVVQGVSLIRFDQSDARYDSTLSLVVQRWLGADEEDAPEYLQQVAENFSDTFVSEVEAEVRRRKCIYSIMPESGVFIDLINKDLSSGSSSVEVDIFRIATPEELDTLEQAGDAGFDREYAKLTAKYRASETGQVGTTDVIAVASDCLLGVHVGTTVDVFKFNDLIALSPQSAFVPEPAE
jgi:DNA-binding phage protein